MVNSNGRCIDELVLGFWRLLDWQVVSDTRKGEGTRQHV